MIEMKDGKKILTTPITDEDLADWVCQIVEKWHQGDPANFIYDWEMYFDGTLTKFDVKLER